MRLGSFWPKLDRRTRWVVLSRWRNSFLSRAITALSLSSLVLANLPEFFDKAGIDLFSLRLVLVGSLVFLLGYGLFGFWAPSEFTQTGEIHDHVQRMRGIADDAFIQSRIGLAESLLDRIRKRHGLKPPDALVRRLSERVTQLRNRKVDDSDAAGLFHADLTLRQYDSPDRRLIVAGTMLVGTGCLAVPTAMNVLRAIWP